MGSVAGNQKGLGDFPRPWTTDQVRKMFTNIAGFVFTGIKAPLVYLDVSITLNVVLQSSLVCRIFRTLKFNSSEPWDKKLPSLHMTPIAFRITSGPQGVTSGGEAVV